jgi:hypothetical protein
MAGQSRWVAAVLLDLMAELQLVEEVLLPGLGKLLLLVELVVLMMEALSVLVDNVGFLPRNKLP